GYTVDEWAKSLVLYPQKSINLTMDAFELSPNKLVGLDQLQQNLDSKGKILVRKSGTEAVIRVMVETEDEELMDETLDRVKDLLAI
ncbi:MAG: phosphoglucosamine mutase, partial [Gammaproteobacteria bacterium]|nr:phosphoglucosamine mutase [Gammaproteobacteria bacterium]